MSRNTPAAAFGVGCVQRKGIATGGVGGLAVGLVAVAAVIGLVANGATVPSRVGGVGVGRSGPDPDRGRPRLLPPPDAAMRAGVPAVSWLTQRGDGVWTYGRGSRPLGVLPARESGLAASDRYLATVLPDGDGRSIVRLRAADTGRRIADTRPGLWVSAGAWTPAGLVVTGYRDATATGDGGLILLTVPGLGAVPLMPAAPFTAALGTPVARGDVLVSASGRFAASYACGANGCDTQAVDLQSRDVFWPTRATEGFLRAVTDEAIVTTDGDGRWISARDLRTGAERWRLRDSILLDPMPAAYGSIVGVVGSARTGWAVAAIDRHGGLRDLTPRAGRDAPWPRIWRELSRPDAIVVARDGGFVEALARGRAMPLLVLDPDGDAARAATITFTPPALAGGPDR